MLDLSTPKRQSPVGIVVLFFKHLRKAVNFVFYFFILKYSTNSSSLVLWAGIVVIAIITLVYSILVYRKFFFYLKDGEFVIEKGLINREKISVPFERIQSVHIDQNVIQRALKVVGLKIDTAGSGTKELEIAALPDSYARSIQEFLLERKKQVAAETDQDAVEQEVEETSKSFGKPLIQLSLLDVVKVGLTENHLKTSFALFALVNGYYWQNQDFFSAFFLDYIKGGQAVWVKKWLLILPLMLISLLLISIVSSIVLSVLKYYGLRFIVSSKEVQKVSGLLKKTEYQIPIHKIQYLKYSSNPLRKLFGLKTIVVKQPSSKASEDKQSLMIPGCKEFQLQAIIHELFPELEKPSFTIFKANVYLKVQMALFFAILPSTFFGLLGFLDARAFSISILWLLIALTLSIQYASKMHLDIDSEVMRLRKGWIFPKTEVVKYYKLQSVSIRQNVFQKRRKVAHLDFYTAAGSLRMWQLDAKVASKLYNYILYKIEDSDKNWM
tara:strand:+ start:70379 stop:71866 length:1488 start_codon:yes stop_codon:yes gene_type:complete